MALMYRIDEGGNVCRSRRFGMINLHSGIIVSLNSHQMVSNTLCKAHLDRNSPED